MASVTPGTYHTTSGGARRQPTFAAALGIGGGQARDHHAEDSRPALLQATVRQELERGQRHHEREQAEADQAEDPADEFGIHMLLVDNRLPKRIT